MMRTIALILGALAAVGTASGEAVAAPQPVYTNKTRFRIPYRYDAAEMQKLGAREIRLFVSMDRGTTWLHVQTVPPETGRFEFQARGDGEYWFAVRTVDFSNRLHPQPDITAPELTVTVDATPPSLEISLRQVEPGRVELAWNASDANLDPRQLRLEYMQTGEPNWQAVSIVPQPVGKTSWSAPHGGFVGVRGMIRDLAGNVGNAQSQIRVEPAGLATPQPSVPNLREPIATDPSSSMTAGMRGQYPAIPASTGPRIMPGSNLGHPNPLSISNSTPSAAPLNGQPVPHGNGSFAGAFGQGPGAAPQPSSAPLPARTRIVNSRRFQIGYKVDDVGPSGIQSVELFITEDDGAKWYRYGVDDDLESPVLVEVPRDGLFGFDLRVRSGAGLSAPPPQPGDKPSMLVAVDETPPVAQLLPAEQGRGQTMNRVQIRWTATDDYLIDRPVALSYASSLGGPWEPISGWIANSGSYEWTIGPGLPARLYIRLTVRDAAGNVSTVESSDPLVVDLSRPTARIVDVESTLPRR